MHIRDFAPALKQFYFGKNKALNPANAEFAYTKAEAVKRSPLISSPSERIASQWILLWVSNAYNQERKNVDPSWYASYTPRGCSY